MSRSDAQAQPHHGDVIADSRALHGRATMPLFSQRCFVCVASQISGVGNFHSDISNVDSAMHSSVTCDIRYHVSHHSLCQVLIFMYPMIRRVDEAKHVTLNGSQKYEITHKNKFSLDNS